MSERRPCEGCKRKLPKGSHPKRRFCSWCQRKRRPGKPRIKLLKKKRRSGPRGRCTPENIKSFCEAYGMGLTQEHAAESIGVSARAITEWFARGRAALEEAGLSEHEPPDDALKRVPEGERCYVQILLESQRVRAQGTKSLFGIMHRSALGGAHWERNPNYDPEDPDSPKYVKTGYNPPDHRAAKHLLAIRHPEYSERQRREISGPGGGPVQTGIVIELPPELPLSAYVKPESEEGGGGE